VATESLGPRAGEIGVPVDAICVGCSSDGHERKATKRVSLEKLGVDDVEDIGTGSFRHVCHRCQRATYWNVVDVREDLYDGGVDE